MKGLNKNREMMIRSHLSKVKARLFACRLYIEDSENYLKDTPIISSDRICSTIKCLELSLREIRKAQGIFEKIKKIK